jgi:lysozyme
MKISDKGLKLIKDFEGLKLTSYLCPANVWTIGYGSTGPHVKQGMTITEKEAEDLLKDDVKRFEECVTDAVEVDLTQDEFDALVSFSFNVGCGAFMGSTLLRLLNAGNKQAAAQQFPRWNKAAGQVLAGLTRRREAEKALYLA